MDKNTTKYSNNSLAFFLFRNCFEFKRYSEDYFFRLRKMNFRNFVRHKKDSFL